MRKLVCRSLLFVPSHVGKMVAKIPSSEADCFCLDLEDAVPLQSKQIARDSISNFLKSGNCPEDRVFVRVNPIESGMTLLDVSETACEELRGFIYPMCRNAEDIISFSAQLKLVEMQLGIEEGRFEIIPLIETPEAVENAHSIASCHHRVSALLFGCEDYLAEIGAKHMEDDISIHYARSKIIGVSRSCGIKAIDTPYVKVKDNEGLEKFSRRASSMGMDGMLVLSPTQVSIANITYSPSLDEVSKASDVVEAEKEAIRMDRGVIVHNGNFISPPTIKAAKRLLSKNDDIIEWSKNRSSLHK